MLLRNFTIPVSTIDDIDNITEWRRFVIIYDYKNNIHYTPFEVYDSVLYDVYVLNTSTVIGKDYIIPQGVVTQFRNSYRGAILNPFLPDGSFNMNSVCNFHSCHYAARINNQKDIIRYTRNDILNDSSFAEFVSNMIKNSIICPFPIYFNIEDQARLAHDKELDFDSNCYHTRSYTLNDLRDSKTTFIKLAIETDQLFQNRNELLNIANNRGILASDMYDVLLQIKEQIFLAFLDCYDIISKSIFAQAYIVFDIEDGLYNVPRENLTLKYSFNMHEKEITNEYTYLLVNISEVFDKYIEPISVDYLNDGLLNIENFSSRITFYVSPTKCKIKMSSPYPAIKSTTLSSEYSLSDTDESTIAKEFSEPIFLSEYEKEYPF